MQTNRSPFLRVLTTRLLLGMSLLFFFSMFQSCEELRFRTGAKRAMAEIKQITANQSRLGPPSGYTVSYEFYHPAAQQRVTGSTVVGTDEAGQYAGQKNVEIEYVGDELPVSSRILGTHNYVWLAIFLGSLLATVLLVVVATILSREPKKTQSGKSRR